MIGNTCPRNVHPISAHRPAHEAVRLQHSFHEGCSSEHGCRQLWLPTAHVTCTNDGNNLMRTSRSRDPNATISRAAPGHGDEAGPRRPGGVLGAETDSNFWWPTGGPSPAPPAPLLCPPLVLPLFVLHPLPPIPSSSVSSPFPLLFRPSCFVLPRQNVRPPSWRRRSAGRAAGYGGGTGIALLGLLFLFASFIAPRGAIRARKRLRKRKERRRRAWERTKSLLLCAPAKEHARATANLCRSTPPGLAIAILVPRMEAPRMPSRSPETASRTPPTGLPPSPPPSLPPTLTVQDSPASGWCARYQRGRRTTRSGSKALQPIF